MDRSVSPDRVAFCGNHDIHSRVGDPHVEPLGIAAR